jgi:hypothetical protein
MRGYVGGLMTSAGSIMAARLAKISKIQSIKIRYRNHGSPFLGLSLTHNLSASALKLSDTVMTQY